MANEAQVKNIYRLGLFREADAGGLKTYTGKDANLIVGEMLGSKERKNLEASINASKTEADKVPTLVTQVQTLTKQLSDNDKAHAEAQNKLRKEIETLDLALTDEINTNTELRRVVEIKEKEIKRLEANQVEGSPWERILGAIKEILRR